MSQIDTSITNESTWKDYINTKYNGSTYYSRNTDFKRRKYLHNLSSKNTLKSNTKIEKYVKNTNFLTMYLNNQRLHKSCIIAGFYNKDQILRYNEQLMMIIAIYELEYFLDTYNCLSKSIIREIFTQNNIKYYNKKYLSLFSKVVRNLYDRKMFDFNENCVRNLSNKLKEYISQNKELINIPNQYKINHKIFDIHAPAYFIRLMLIQSIIKDLNEVSYKIYNHQLNSILSAEQIFKISFELKLILLNKKTHKIISPQLFVLALLKYFDYNLSLDIRKSYDYKISSNEINNNYYNNLDLFNEIANKINF